MEWVVVDRTFPAELSGDAIEEMAKAPSCLDLYRVEVIRSYLSPDKRRMICICRAPDAESVRIALRNDGSPPVTAWSCTLHTP